MSSAYSIQSSNRNRTLLIIGFFIVLTTVIGYAASWILGHYFIFVLAILIAVGQSFAAYFWGDKVALAFSRAEPLSPEQAPQVHLMVENLSKVADISKPRIFLSPDQSANAFAAGRDPEHAVICFHQGLLDLLNENELEGVIAHELSHIKNRDSLVMMVTMVLSSLISLLVDMTFRLGFLFGGRDGDRKISPLVLIFYVILMILSPLLALLMQMAVSRSREYLADATAVTLTRYPEGLIGALQKLYQQSTKPSFNVSSMRSLYIAPVKGGFGQKIQELFSTHPSLDDRLAKLRQM